MFNLTGSEIIFILLIALVVLGPEKLPGAIRRAMRTYQELRRLGDGFQSEFRSVVDEPMREMRETASLLREQADPAKIAAAEEAEAHRLAAEEKAAAKAERSRSVVAEMHAAGGSEPQLSDHVAEHAFRDDMESSAGNYSDTGADEWADPVDTVEASAPAPTDWGVPAGAPADPLAPPADPPAAAPPGLPDDPTASSDTDGESAA